MEIVSYNIWDLPLWFVRHRKERMLEIARVLAERGSEIICLQESWSLDNRAALSAFLKAKGYHDAIGQAGITRNNGGLLTFSKFPIVSIRFVSFGRKALSVSEIIGNKGVLETVLETPQGLLRVLNIHLHHQSSKYINTKNVRLRQLRQMIAVLKQSSPLPTILAGDFNNHNMMEDSAYSELFEASGFIHHPNSTMLYDTYRAENPLVNNWINRIARSQRYDYILTKDIEQAGFIFEAYTPWHINPPLSDHDPVILQLRGSSR